MTLRLVLDEPDQVLRLAAFRAEHPAVIILPGAGPSGTWEARIPEPAGETVTVRYTLRELLDKLDELTGGGCPSGQPAPPASRPASAATPALMNSATAGSGTRRECPILSERISPVLSSRHTIALDSCSRSAT